MTKSKRHDELGKALSSVAGFSEGVDVQLKIIALGERLRELRENVLNLSQTEAAKLIGFEQSELSRLENGVGKRGPSYVTITRITDAYEKFLRSQKHSDYSLKVSLELTAPSGDAVKQ